MQAVSDECIRLGLDQLTLYAFSNENWRRPKREVDFLMTLLVRYLAEERQAIMENDVRFKAIGRIDELPRKVKREIASAAEASANNTGLTVCLAINYGARQEIADAAKAIAADAAAGRLDPDAVDEQTVRRYLYTADMPDPDLLIRTASEMRLSNFLLWQVSYAELYVSPVYWPDFRVPEFRQALAEYARRDRRYGGLSEVAPRGGKEGGD